MPRDAVSRTANVERWGGRILPPANRGRQLSRSIFLTSCGFNPSHSNFLFLVLHKYLNKNSAHFPAKAKGDFILSYFQKNIFRLYFDLSFGLVGFFYFILFYFSSTILFTRQELVFIFEGLLGFKNIPLCSKSSSILSNTNWNRLNLIQFSKVQHRGYYVAT